MLIIDNLDHLPQALSCPILAIGVFDGVHLGHQKILRHLVERAHETKGQSLLLTFTPHPQKVISAGDSPLLLQTAEQKEEILDCFGVDILIKLSFTRTLSLYTPDQFARDILYSHGIREIHVGSNFRFGHRRSGDFTTLDEMGKKYGFEVREIRPVFFRNERVSSTKARRSLAEGRTSLTRCLLGRAYEIRGTVVRGAGRGVQIGFRTANIRTENELIPATGVYVTRLNLGRDWHPSVTNIGFRPTVEEDLPNRPIIETHLLDYAGDLYGKSVSLQFFRRLRPEIKFSGVEELKNRIAADVARARIYFRRGGSRLEEQTQCP